MDHVVFGRAKQIGSSLPAKSLFNYVWLAAGARAGSGKRNLALAGLLSVVACVGGDVLRYELGRHRGPMLNLLRRIITMESGSCARRTENFFTLHGARAPILATFIPSLSMLAPALARLFGIGHKGFPLY